MATWRGRRAAAAGVAIVAALVCAVAPQDAFAAQRPAAGDAAGRAREADASSGWTLPSRTYTRADGVRVREADPAALKALVSAAAAANPGCGYECEGQDPSSYWLHPAGGPSNWYRCGDDATTVREAYLPGGSSTKVELRYSPRCRTAWTRGTTFFYLATYSYTSRTTPNYRTYTDSGRNPNVPSTNIHWTAMVNDAGLYASACMYQDDLGENCTSRY